MDAKSSISLVNVQKPSANTPVLRRRSKLMANIDSQISKIQSYREGKRVSREQFWLADKHYFFAMRYGKAPLAVAKGMSTLKAPDLDDLVAQLDEIKTITLAGGLDDVLAAAAGAVKANFKAAKDKKAGRG